MKTLSDIQKEFLEGFTPRNNEEGDISINRYLNIIGDQKQFIRHALRELLEQVVPEKRGSEEQERNCGLYHWNDCRQEVEDKIKKILE